MLRTIAVLGSVGLLAIVGLIVFRNGVSADHYDNMFKTANTGWNCFDGGSSPNGNACQNDNGDVTYCFEASISGTGQSTINSVLANEYAPTILTITFDSSCDYSGGSETDIVYQYRTDLGAGLAGRSWCDDSNNSTQCDQHYDAFSSASPSYALVCHETGHSVGLVHGPNADPTQPDGTASLGCMGNAAGSMNSLGSHNADQIDSTY